MKPKCGTTIHQTPLVVCEVGGWSGVSCWWGRKCWLAAWEVVSHELCTQPLKEMAYIVLAYIIHTIFKDALCIPYIYFKADSRKQAVMCKYVHLFRLLKSSVAHHDIISIVRAVLAR